jgi:nitrate/nitrite transporter NarK
MFSSYHHVIVMIILGFAYAGFVASVWPLVPLAVKEDQVGLGYGIMTALQNTGLTIVPLMIALIKHESGSYGNARWLFLGLSSGTLLVSMWLANELPGLTPRKHIDSCATDLETEPLAAQAESQYS